MIPLDTLPAAVREAFIGLESEFARLRDEGLRQQQSSNFRPSKSGSLTSSCFGPKSEQLSPDQMQLLQTEIQPLPGEVEAGAQRPAAEKAAPRPKVKIPARSIRAGTAAGPLGTARSGAALPPGGLPMPGLWRRATDHRL